LNSGGRAFGVATELREWAADDCFILLFLLLLFFFCWGKDEMAGEREKMVDMRNKIRSLSNRDSNQQPFDH
jgi:hypothetical protein